MHHHEYVYRDIQNALEHLNPNGVILCHDMNPLFEEFAVREYNPDYIWNGDCWKAFVQVRSERTDISTIMIEDCDWGVGLIRFGGDPALKLDKPISQYTFQDFEEHKGKLMNTTTLQDFIDRMGLDIDLTQI